MIIKTVFAINDCKSQTTATVLGSGNDAINNIRALFPTEPIILRGFIINDRYRKADLTPSWNKKFN